MIKEKREDIIKLTFHLRVNYPFSVEDITMLLNKKSIEYVIKQKLYTVLLNIDYKAETLFDDVDIINILEKDNLQEIYNKIIKPLNKLIERLNKNNEGAYVDSINDIINIINNKKKIKRACDIIKRS